MAASLRSGKSLQRGATYLLLLFAIAILSAGLATSAQLWSALHRRHQLTQLEWVGEQYRRAIGSYYEASPGTVKRYPASLDELVIDNRYLSLRRHIRALYQNPMTPTVDWEPIRAPDGGVMGLRHTDERLGAREFIYRPAITAPGRPK